MGIEILSELKPIVKDAFKRTLIIAEFFCGLHVIDSYVCTPTWVMGPSMLPTFNLTGSLVLSERISPQLGKIEEGDVVVARSPENPRKVSTKRVVAMEGQTVTYKVNPKKGNEEKTVIVPKGHVWLEGDNRYNSRDSRAFGPVPYGLIQARVFYRVWPFEEFGSMDSRRKANAKAEQIIQE